MTGKIENVQQNKGKTNVLKQESMLVIELLKIDWMKWGLHWEKPNENHC